jgi:hypothetical protein
MAIKHDYYELIGVSRTATLEEIVAACLRLGEKYRPDRNPHDALAAETFALVESAFDVLGDPEKRAAYDAVLADSEQPQSNGTVKILDAGTKRLISGPEAAHVEAALNDHLARGSKLVTPLGKLGSIWIAACTVPVKVHPADQTATLNLTEFPRPRDPYADEDDGVCRIEKVGFTWIVRGPTKVEVQARAEELVDLGAKLVGEIEIAEDGQWTATCDTGGSQNTGFRW